MIDSKTRFLLSTLIAGLGLIPTGRLTAQTFTTLHGFTATSASYPYTNNDGANPYGGLILSGSTLYGTAGAGGSWGKGTVFKVNTDGTGFAIVHAFTGTIDGGSPLTGLIVSGGTLYGATQSGGTWGKGALFKVNTDGTAFTTVYSYSLSGSDGFSPAAGLILSGNTLYGTTEAGGSLANGTLFAVNTDGTGFTTLHNFTGGSDGSNPYAGVTISGNTLYGTTVAGGAWGGGTAFQVNTDGTGFATLHSFTATSAPSYTNSDGTYPLAGLTFSGNTLYGAALNG